SEHLRSNGDDLVGVPLVGLDDFLARFVVGQHLVVKVFAVEFSPPTLAGVGLKAAHLVALKRLAVKLNAAVSFIGHELDFADQPEVADGDGALKELVSLQACSGFANDLAILDMIDGHISPPAG